ncbi:MAG: multidrug efflux pump subunit AcrB [Alphaproteobacteria bacterium]|jgi:multidrug efflux pump subunit AcrB
MTTLTTVLGLVPLILFGGALFYGMASVIAFGLIVATLITLGFVPALYTLLFGISTRDAPTAARSTLQE